MTEAKKVSADICSYVDENTQRLNMEVSIPGVKKENIDLKIQEDAMALSAKRNSVEYVTTMGFCCPVKASEAQATYESGLLKISVPFKDPMEAAHQVAIN